MSVWWCFLFPLPLRYWIMCWAWVWGCFRIKTNISFDVTIQHKEKFDFHY